MEGFRGCGIPGQRLGSVSEKRGEWSTYLTEVGDETMVEICKSQETMKVLYCGGLEPFKDGFYLLLVHLHATFVDEIPQKMDGVAVELTLL